MSDAQESDEAPAIQSPAASVYIGPNVSKYGLRTFQVFKGAPPAAPAGDPVLARLFVSPENLRAARAALGVEGSPEWSAYRDAVVAFNKRGAR